MNIAALYSLPVIFFLENNFYAVSTHVREQTRETRLSSRGPMLGIPAIEVDGMELLAVRRAMQEARRMISERGGPVMIEAICYRFLHQSGPRPGSEFGYRSREEEKEWQARDPIATFPERLQAAGADRRRCAGTPRRQGARGGRGRRRPSHRAGRRAAISFGCRQDFFPDAASVDTGIRGNLGELSGERFRELPITGPRS
jgi:Pyruvate/2-oxoglutarate dehydrogenase complex, dehydrogenase (E1) component, eukaryotic type, alpha subunit